MCSELVAHGLHRANGGQALLRVVAMLLMCSSNQGLPAWPAGRRTGPLLHEDLGQRLLLGQHPGNFHGVNQRIPADKVLCRARMPKRQVAVGGGASRGGRHGEVDVGGLLRQKTVVARLLGDNRFTRNRTKATKKPAARERGRASRAVRSQAEPGNEKKTAAQ